MRLTFLMAGAASGALVSLLVQPAQPGVVSSSPEVDARPLEARIEALEAKKK